MSQEEMINKIILFHFNELGPMPVSETEGHPIAKAVSIGFNAKSVYTSDSDELYLTKKLFKFNAQDVFNQYLPGKIELNPGIEKHLNDLLIESAYLECLAPLIAGRLFKDVLTVPDNYFYVDSNESVIIISKFINGFSEFLTNKHAVKGKGPGFWEREKKPLPKREDLNLSEREAEIIGTLYAVALLFNHWDFLNNYFRNSGYVRNDGNYSACIIDWGQSLHQAELGQLCDSLTVMNPLFKLNAPIQYNFDSSSACFNRYEHSMPFDSRVYPLPKKSLIRDMYEMSGDDETSKTILRGFKNALVTARANLNSNSDLLKEAICDSEHMIAIDSHVTFDQLKRSLNQEYYGFAASPTGSTYCLETLLKERLLDLEKIVVQLEQGRSLTSIAEEVRNEYYLSNLGMKKQ